MKRAALGAVLGVSLFGGAIAAPTSHSTTGARANSTASGSDRLTTIVTQLSDAKQQLIVVDQETHVLAVYQIETANGAVKLVSVRNLHWDLQMEHFNGTSPLPGEIRARIEQR